MDAAAQARLGSLGIMSLLNILLFSGVCFGWASVRLMLESEGVVAPAQAERTYSIIFSVAAFLVNGISVPSGILLDKAGAACTAAVAGGCMAVGLVGFGMAESPATLTVSYALIAVGGQMTLFAGLPVAFLLDPSSMTLFLAALSGFFDASSLVFRVMLTLFERYHVSRRALFLGYAAVAAPCYAMQLLVWRRYTVSTRSGGGGTGSASDGSSNSTSGSDGGGGSHDEERGRLQAQPEYGTVKTKTHVGVATEMSADEFRAMPVSRQVRSTSFAFITVFASVGILCANTYIASIEQLMTGYGDHTGAYARLFGLILPAGAIFIPLVGVAVRVSVRCGFFCTLGLSVAVSALSMVPVIAPAALHWAAWGAFLSFGAYRCFLYSTMSNYIAMTFGPASVGRITGFVFSIAALLNTVQAPLLIFVNDRYFGDVVPIQELNVALMLALVPLVCAKRM